MLASNFSTSTCFASLELINFTCSTIFEQIIFELNIQLPAQRISHPVPTLHLQQVQPAPAPPHASSTHTHPAPAHRAVQLPTLTLQMQVPATRAGWPTRVKPVRVLPATCTGKPVRVKISCAVEEAYNSSTLANPRNYSLITEADVTQQMQVHSCSAIWMWGVWGFVG